MANIYGSHSFEKVTFNISSELKEQVMALKDELKVSLSSIYNEAIANYLNPNYALEITHLLQSISTWAFTKYHRFTYG